MKTKEKEERAAFVLRQCFLCAARARGKLSAFPFSFSIERRGRFRLRKRPPLYYFYLVSLYILYYFFIARRSALFSRRQGRSQNGREIRWANGSKYEFFRLLRSRFGLRRGLRHFIKIIAVAFVPHQIALINHFVHIGVEGGFANARVLFRVLLRQIEIIAVAVGSKIEVELKPIGR